MAAVKIAKFEDEKYIYKARKSNQPDSETLPRAQLRSKSII